MEISVKDMQKENGAASDELEKWRQSYRNLKEEKEKLYVETATALNDKDKEIRNLHNVNKELLDYINCLENKQTFKIRARM